MFSDDGDNRIINNRHRRRGCSSKAQIVVLFLRKTKTFQYSTNKVIQPPQNWKPNVDEGIL